MTIKIVGAIALTLGTAAVSAQTQTLRDAVESAWARQPIARAAGARELENDAKLAAARALTPSPPAIGIAHLTDRPARDEGLREWEAELEVPLWLPGQRDRLRAVVDAERVQLTAKLAALKWRLAGEVREAYWQARLAENELALARQKLTEAGTIVRQVDRRFQAGDVSRIDLNQALAQEQAARAAVAENEVKVYRARQAFTLLTALPGATPSEETRAAAPADLDAHPLLTSLRQGGALARSKLAQATGDRRDNPDVAVGMRRERPSADAPFGNAAIIRFRFPFGTDARNQPRITAANAELIEADAEWHYERARLETEIETARRELEQLGALVGLAETRFRTAADNQRLIARGFELGEFDLVMRLRAENERFEAELAATRARLEVGHAVSRLNQALGVLP